MPEPFFRGLSTALTENEVLMNKMKPRKVAGKQVSGSQKGRARERTS